MVDTKNTHRKVEWNAGNILIRAEAAGAKTRQKEMELQARGAAWGWEEEAAPLAEAEAAQSGHSWGSACFQVLLNTRERPPPAQQQSLALSPFLPKIVIRWLFWLPLCRKTRCESTQLLC